MIAQFIVPRIFIVKFRQYFEFFVNEIDGEWDKCSVNYGEILHEYGLTERTDLGSDPNEILAVQMEGVGTIKIHTSWAV